ncbi:MAG: enoyl-CoA hydratase [Dehalococcoidia bacterium]|nr:enoyl-CoA hydratase [Dehalococcoidia bacterium]
MEPFYNTTTRRDKPVTSDILCERRDGIATVTFNRPERRNAITYDGWQLLSRIAEEVASDDDVRVVVFTGSGDLAFSAGADIADVDRYRHDAESAKGYAAAFDGALDAVESIPKPTISLIRGYCIGGGCELSMATDMRIAASGSRFAIPVAKLNILIGYKEMRRLVRLVGPGHANYILMSGRQIDAEEAVRIGLVDRMLPDDEIAEYVYGLAREMVPLAPLSQRRHKEIMQIALENPGLLELTPEQEDLPFANFDSEDFIEGRRAFLERRPPRFQGR